MKQDFEESSKVTHCSYILHSDAFIEGGYQGSELKNAQRGHALLGYNFVVTRISAIATDSAIDVEVTVEQIGVAPFYYPLSLALHCPELQSPLTVGGLDGIIDQGVSTTFTVHNVPATWPCLQDISISMDSPMLLSGRKMKFAQGNGAVNIKIPMPSRSMEAVYDSDQSNEDDEEVVEKVAMTRQPTVADSGKRRGPLLQQPVDDFTVEISFAYLASRLNETEQWVPLLDGDVVDIPQFGLSVAALTDNAVSSIWFSYGPGEMHIDSVPPYTLSRNNYLVSSGTKELVATAFVDGGSPTVTKLMFVAVAPSGGLTMKEYPIASVEKRFVGVDRAELKAVEYDAHGFNTPFAPSLLQLVALDRMSATGKDVRVGEDLGRLEEMEHSSAEARMAGLIVPVWCLLLMLGLQ